jgi:hypothetical protein
MTNAIAGRSVLPPPPRAPISRFCITRKEYVSARPFVGGPSLREDHSSRKLRSSPEGDGLGLRPGNSRRPVGTRSRRGLPRAWAASTQAPTPRPGPQGPVRPRGARCRPSRDAATTFTPAGGRGSHGRPQSRRSLLGAIALRPRRDRAAWRRSARLRPRRCPRRPRRQLRPRTRPGAGAPLDPGGNRRRPVPCRATASPDRTSRRAAGNGLGQGRGDLAFASHAICTYNRQHSANTASCQRSFLPA